MNYNSLGGLTFLGYVQLLSYERAAAKVIDLLPFMGMCLCLWYLSRSSFCSCDDQASQSHAQIIPSIARIPQYRRDDNVGQKESSAHGVNIYERLNHVCIDSRS